MLQERMLRKILKSKRDLLRERWRNCTMRSIIIYTLHKILL
jgi:hypothetical protein